jgi:hypothetical protein
LLPKARPFALKPKGRLARKGNIMNTQHVLGELIDIAEYQENHARLRTHIVMDDSLLACGDDDFLAFKAAVRHHWDVKMELESLLDEYLVQFGFRYKLKHNHFTKLHPWFEPPRSEPKSPKELHARDTLRRAYLRSWDERADAISARHIDRNERTQAEYKYRRAEFRAISRECERRFGYFREFFMFADEARASR